MKCLVCDRPTKSSHHKWCNDKCKKMWFEDKTIAAIDKLPDFPKFDEYLTLDWEKWACTADWHLPFVKKSVFQEFIYRCKKRDVTKLLIAGDFLDMNQFSSFFSFTRVAWKDEKNFAKEVVKILISELAKQRAANNIKK